VFDFTVELGKNYKLNENYTCGIIETYFEVDSEVSHEIGKHNLFIFCDICESNYVRNSFLPLLRLVSTEEQLYTPLYKPISRYEFNKIRVYIRDINLDIPIVPVKSFTCTLHFKISQ